MELPDGRDEEEPDTEGEGELTLVMEALLEDVGFAAALPTELTVVHMDDAGAG